MAVVIVRRAKLASMLGKRTFHNLMDPSKPQIMSTKPWKIMEGMYDFDPTNSQLCRMGTCCTPTILNIVKTGLNTVSCGRGKPREQVSSAQDQKIRDARRRTLILLRDCLRNLEANPYGGKRHTAQAYDPKS
jgi:hypothetical protein